MLELRNIAKRLGDFTLEEFNLKLEAGEYFVQLGPSGVGKTILIELIAGLLQPDRGQILWDEQELTQLPPEARNFAVVYQDYALFPHLTVEENILYGLKARKLRKQEHAERLEQMLESLRIAELRGRYPDTLSGGEQQRVAVARALIVRPRLLLLDEPLSALELKTRRTLRRLLRRAQEETGAIFFHVTHDIEEAIALGHRVGVLLDGRLRQAGPPEELFRRPSDRDVADFLGMRNLLPVSSVSDHVCRCGAVDIHVAHADADVAHLWIKPEEIVLSRQAYDSSARNQFQCTVADWEHSNSLLVIHLRQGELKLSSLITYESFEKLEIERGDELYATFKSSAVHCF